MQQLLRHHTGHRDPCSSFARQACGSRPVRVARVQRLPRQMFVLAVQAAPRGAVNSSASMQSVENMASPSGSWALGPQGTQPVYTRFHWPRNLGSPEEVQVWGSWNGWSKGWALQRQHSGQDYCVVVPMKPGNYEFKFVVNKVWQAAPHEPTTTGKEGTLNNYRVVAPTVHFSYKASDAKQVLVLGDWDDWQYSLVLKKDPATGLFTGQGHLKPGHYSYQYCVDGVFLPSPEEKCDPHAEKDWCHKVWSYEPEIFRVFYQTGWEETVMHFRRLGQNGQAATQEFTTIPMVGATSRGNNLGMWKMATVVPQTEDEAIEFYLSNGQTNGKLKEDRAPASTHTGNTGLYQLPLAGSFKLCRGQVKPFSRGSESRFMLVSDIDGTMIGDPNAPDGLNSSQRFADYWENSAALAGAVLVYNTGRSLGQFVELMRRCEGRLAVPDVVITAVGTKVWHLDEAVGRSTASGLNWVEDQVWTQQLDAGWNLNTVRAAARKLIQSFNDPGALTLLDDGSEHRHRLALSCDHGAVQHVTASLASALQREGLEVRIIVSGNGSHRYVDCVPVSAGKEKALQYVRQRYAIPEHLCVAAGDSGNDVLMLEGDHPAIVVGNAQPELVHWLVAQPQRGKIVYADAWYADGILEGLARHSLY